MTRSGKTANEGDPEPMDFSLATKRQMAAKLRSYIWDKSEGLQYEFRRLKDKIDWDQLRTARSEAEVNSAFAALDEFDRNRLASTPAILATVREAAYPKLRPFRFLAESCALALYKSPANADEYSPRYSRDICYKERRRRGPAPKQISNLEYWRMQAEAGMRVPIRFLRRINKADAKKRRKNAGRNIRIPLTYSDIPEKIGNVKKKRTTIWLPESTIAKLKELSVSTGAPMAEIFRRAIEAYLQSS